MPHIAISAYDENKNIKQMNIHLDIQFKREYFHTPKAMLKMDELQNRLEKLIGEYFDEYESETYSNHEWNSRMNNY